MLGVPAKTSTKPDHVTKNDHELFLQAFEKPTQIYKLLSYRHYVNPVFLHRNLSYMKHRNSRSHIERCNSVETIAKNLSKKVQNCENLKSREGALKIAITGIDNKGIAANSTEIYEVQIHLHNVSNKKQSEEQANSTLLCTLKYTTNDKKSCKSPSKIHPVTTIRGSTLNKYTSGKSGCVLEFRVKLKSAKSARNKSSPPKKRQCVEDWYSADLVVQTERNTTLLGEGSYTLFLRPLSSEDWESSQVSWEPSQVSWEPIGTQTEEGYLKSDLMKDSDKLDNMSSISFDIKTDSLPGDHATPRTSPLKVRKPPTKMSKNSSNNQNILLYNFLYNGSTQQQTECRKNMVCPWCTVNCTKIYPLLEHISCCHPRFKVTYVPGLSGVNEIDIEINELLNLPCFSSPDEDLVPVFTGPNKRKIHCLAMKHSMYNMARTEKDFMTLDISPYPAPHTRLYFHSTSYEPILPTEVDYDSDNDNDGSMSWIKDKTKQLIQDFTDVNEGEKEMMIMWNCFVFPIRPLADHKVPEHVWTFTKQEGEKIIKRGLIQNYLLHLVNLHSYGLLKADDIEALSLHIYALQDSLS